MTYFRGQLNRQFLFALSVGMLSGFMVAYLMLASNNNSDSAWFPFPLGNSDPHSSEALEHAIGPESDPGTHDPRDEFHRLEDTRVADQLRERVRVLCWVMTGPTNHEKKARHVYATWGKRCTVILFMSSAPDTTGTLPIIALPVAEGRDHLWAKTKHAFRYVYEHYRNEADWFLKADDDTYVILENLRYMLSAYRASEPLYFGCRFKPFVRQGYMSGGAGYVLSKEALRRFVEQALPQPHLCSGKNDGSEDVEMGRCLEQVGVQAQDTRDMQGRGRFFPFVPEHHLIPTAVRKDFWFWKYIYYDSKQGMDCCSDNAVSFHYVSPNQMYVLEYLIYHLRPYGITYRVDTRIPFLNHMENYNTTVGRNTNSSQNNSNNNNNKNITAV